jgi:hypothetical protein
LHTLTASVRFARVPLQPLVRHSLDGPGSWHYRKYTMVRRRVVWTSCRSESLKSYLKCLVNALSGKKLTLTPTKSLCGNHCPQSSFCSSSQISLVRGNFEFAPHLPNACPRAISYKRFRIMNLPANGSYLHKSCRFSCPRLHNEIIMT